MVLVTWKCGKCRKENKAIAASRRTPEVAVAFFCETCGSLISPRYEAIGTAFFVKTRLSKTSKTPAPTESKKYAH
jgi:hypothetical protein